jgi:ankyrin repeat protein
LLQAGAEVNIQPRHGRTPLIYAVAYDRNPEILNLLLKSRAEARVKDTQKGWTALDGAQGNESLKGTEVYRKLVDATPEKIN